MVYQRGTNMGSNMGARMHSYPLYQDLQQKAEPLAEVLCRRLFDASVSVDNQTERVEGEMVSGNYFSMLGVKPAAGRVFNSQEDDQIYRGHPVVVLSHAYWMRRFAGDRSVVGRKILVNNYPMTVVGVSAEGFGGLDPARAPQIRVPILMKPIMMPEWGWFEMPDRRARWVQVFARLKPGYTVRVRRRAVAGTVHADPRLRNDAAGGQGLVEVRARRVHEGAAPGDRSVARLLVAAQRLLHRAASC